MLKRMIIHVLGLILIALGVAVIVKISEGQTFGIFPWDAAGVNLMNLFSKWGLTISIGTASLILNSTLGVICILFTKNLKYLYSFINIIIFSVSLDASKWLLGLITWPNLMWLILIMLFIGLLLIAIGTNFVVISNLVPSPAESAMLIIHNKWFPKSLGLSKVALEALFLCVALSIGALSGDVFANLGWFTFVAVAVLSPLIQITHKPIKLLYGGDKK